MILRLLTTALVCGFSSLGAISDKSLIAPKKATQANYDITITYEDLTNPNALTYYDEAIRLAGLNKYQAYDFKGYGLFGGFKLWNDIWSTDIDKLRFDGVNINFYSSTHMTNGNSNVYFNVDFQNMYWTSLTIYDEVNYLRDYDPIISITFDANTNYQGYKFASYYKYLLAGNSDYYFTFNEAFNYNAFAQSGNQVVSNIDVRGKSPFIDFGNLDQAITDIDIYTPWFSVNGESYNVIRARFHLATTDLLFEWYDSFSVSKVIDGHNPYKYFGSLYYINTETSSTLNVATRLKYLNNEGKTCISMDVDWLNDSYRTINFFVRPISTSYSYIVLDMANNNLVNSGFNNAITGEVGLGNVFTLVTQAFASWTPILAIQIVPGITIGLLLFLPLITGIIILIIWIVKR